VQALKRKLVSEEEFLSLPESMDKVEILGIDAPLGAFIIHEDFRARPEASGFCRSR
jgi:hypothetical protein